MSPPPTYIGDGVYAHHDGCYLWLETQRGRPQPDQIALEPAAVIHVVRYAVLCGMLDPHQIARDVHGMIEAHDARMEEPPL